MNNINKENIQETKPENYTDKYFKYLCILPWIYTFGQEREY